MDDVIHKSYRDACYDYLPDLVEERQSDEIEPINKELNSLINEDLHSLVNGYGSLPTLAKKIMNESIDKDYVDFSEEIKIEIDSAESSEEDDDEAEIDNTILSTFRIRRLFRNITIK